MKLFVLLGLIFFGVLLIGLELFQRAGRQCSSSSSFRQSDRTNSITNSMQVKQLREISSLSQPAQLWHSRRKSSAKGLRQVRPSRLEKLSADYTPAKSFQQVKPAAEKWQMNHSQKVNLPFEQMMLNRRTKSAHDRAALSSFQPSDPAFEQTKLYRRTKPDNDDQASSPFPQETNSTDAQTQIRVSQRSSTFRPDNPADVQIRIRDS